MNTKQRKAKHGHTRQVDGKVKYSRTYLAWRNMRNRCCMPTIPEYKHYGGRGIRVCDRWNGDNGFLLFLEDMGECPEGLTLDRIDVDGDYEPNNCRWISRTDNQRNQRRAKLITWNGQTKHFIEWAEELGINPDTLRSRVFRHGWSIERAMTENVKHVES